MIALGHTGLFEAAGRFWRWWTGELADALPVRLRPQGPPRALIRLSRSTVEITRIEAREARRFLEQYPLEALDSDSWQQLAAIGEGARCMLVLAPEDVHLTELVLPEAVRGHLHRAVSLQLERIAPLVPRQLAWACAVTTRDGRMLNVAVAMARAERLVQLSTLFAQAGLQTPPIYAEHAGGTIELASGHDGSRTPGWYRKRYAMVAAALLVCSIPFTTVAAAAFCGWIEQARIERLQQDVAPKLAAESRARRAETIKSALRVLDREPGVTGIMAGVAAGLPATAFLRSIEVRPDHHVRLVVDGADGEKVEAALVHLSPLQRAAIVDQAADDPRRLTIEARLAR